MTGYIDAGKLLQALSNGEMADPKLAIYVAELYKQILSILLKDLDKTLVITKSVIAEYEENVPELEVFHADFGDIYVRLKK